jgi:hypothetical protein
MSILIIFTALNAEQRQYIRGTHLLDAFQLCGMLNFLPIALRDFEHCVKSKYVGTGGQSQKHKKQRAPK